LWLGFSRASLQIDQLEIDQLAAEVMNVGMGS
jgi:hypothetical protein